MRDSSRDRERHLGRLGEDRRLRFRHFRGYRRICRADGFFPEGAVPSRGRKRAEHTFPSIFVRHFSEHLPERANPRAGR